MMIGLDLFFEAFLVYSMRVYEWDETLWRRRHGRFSAVLSIGAAYR